MTKTIDYYFPPQSPFAYLGHARFAELVARLGCEVRVRPCDMGEVFKQSGGLPLGQRAPQRQAYRLVELARWRDFLGLPMNTQPAFFPVAADPASKLIIAADLDHGSAAAMTVAGAVFSAVWAEQKNIADVQTLADLATASGLDGRLLVERSQSPEVAAQYQAHTRAALDAGVFGAPWFVFEGQGYWGQDRLDFLERAITKAAA
ncbi:2-hydroxychromene-2-carboxylate isomerase [Rhodoferax koreense]|uniref:2-hydroxychromene-2-carboxylate isomerase n=1 Tax=Rhodoferax koreensis TaxID=1842727 RepID=A0A1P8JT65_9BURK|nr:2-hydroxychromene-2-carboxylate isomerase [Rhodoferax koreense]APW36946.1 2-hydroxychromene-2-carboxylate isomerase [Rhodoferax koreense]